MVLRFTQTFGVHAGRVMDFDQSLITIGRRPDNDFAFDVQLDRDASGRHAEIQYSPTMQSYVLVDTQSRNGTWINGKRVQKQILNDGDQIEFGKGGPRIKLEIIDGATVVFNATEFQDDKQPKVNGRVGPSAMPVPTTLVPPNMHGRAQGEVKIKGAPPKRSALSAAILWLGVVLIVVGLGCAAVLWFKFHQS